VIKFDSESTFNNISVISWRSVLLVKETGVCRENHRPVVVYTYKKEVFFVNNILCGFGKFTGSMILKFMSIQTSVGIHVAVCLRDMGIKGFIVDLNWLHIKCYSQRILLFCMYKLLHSPLSHITSKKI
jgi:hypothetical protein